MNANWTPEDDATLVRLIGKGASASQVGIELGRSRNAVCGRIHRLRLQPKHIESKRAARPAKPPKFTTRTPFSPAEDKIIREMAAEGKSGSDIGQVLNRHLSSVVKRARKIGTPLRGKSGPEKVEIRKNAFSAAKRESRQRDPESNHVTPAVFVEPLMLALVDLTERTCKFPIGDPLESTFGFCGHPSEDGAYCRHHAAIAYTPPEMRRRAA